MKSHKSGGSNNIFNWTYAIFGLIILLIIVSLALTWQNNRAVNMLFDGFYSGDPVFCEDGNLEMMIMYFDKGDGYIMIQGADGTILLNDAIHYTLKNKSGSAMSLSKPKLYEITFTGIDYQSFFPTKQMLEFVPTTQRIKMFDNEEKKIHAVLYKNNSVSDVKALLPET